MGSCRPAEIQYIQEISKAQEMDFLPKGTFDFFMKT